MNIHLHPKHRSQTHNGSYFSYFREVCKSRDFTAFIFDVLVKFLQFDKEKITWSKAKYYAQPKFCGFFLVIFDICSYFVEGSQLWNVNDVNASKRKDEISQDREKNLSVKDCEITWVDAYLNLELSPFHIWSISLFNWPIIIQLNCCT